MQTEVSQSDAISAARARSLQSKHHLPLMSHRPTMSTKINVETFLSVLRKSGLVDRDRLDAALKSYAPAEGADDDPVPLSDHLIAENLLSRWQTEKLLQGKHRGYFLGKYKLLALLGKGGMSSVYLAEHLLLRRRCALKVLPAKRVDDSSYLERFHREAQAVAALDHPNIVRAYDVDHQADGERQIHFLVMEHVDGQSLQELVAEKGVVSFLDAAEYTRQSAAGLQHAHELGMIHRDIKPGNLLVDQNGVVKVLDLGLARFFMVDEGNEALTIRHDEKVLGTADYLAPEQALDSHTVDVRADLYSLGCTLYFMLTGQPPFTEGTLAQRLMAHQVKTPPAVESLRPDIPPTLAAILRKMMQKKPSDRYATASETEKALFDWINENADDPWRKAHSDVYGSRSSDSGSVLKAIPVAQPVITGSSSAVLAESPKKSVEEAKSTKPLSTKLKLPKVASTGTADPQDTEVSRFFSNLAQPNSPQSMSKNNESRPISAPPTQAAESIRVDAPGVSPQVVPTSNGPSATSSPFPIFEPPSPGKPTVAKTTAVKPASLKSKPGRQQMLWESLNGQWKDRWKEVAKKLSLSAWVGIAAACTLALVIGIYVIGSFGDGNKTKQAKRTAAVPFPKDQREVRVGGPKSDYAKIGDALTAVRERYRPSNGGTDRFVVRITEGTYQERIRIDGRKNRWPEGVTLLGEGKVHLESDGDEPVVRLSNTSRFTIENFEIEAKDRRVAVELADDLHESRISKLIVRGFTDTGILCKGAQGLSFGNNQLFIEQVTFEPGSTQASGIRIEEGVDNNSNSIVIRGCRFLGPMAAGIQIRDKSPYGIDVAESIFQRTTDGVYIYDQPLLKSIHFLNNSFRQTKSGIRFSRLPHDLSTDLAFRRNLFVETEVAEALMPDAYDDVKFRTMLSSNPAGVENNWSDRAKPGAPTNGEMTFLFDQGGRQGELGFAFASTDPKNPKFLAPTEKSPQREVKGTQTSDKQWVGAVGQ